MNKASLKEILFSQKEDLATQTVRPLILRDLDLTHFINEPEVTILSGVRRCGKSFLLEHFLNHPEVPRNILFMSFEDPRLVDFQATDFLKLYEIWSEDQIAGLPRVACFDEIQNVQGWEQWMNFFSKQKNFKVFVTGSNSNLLSSELATHLTGRSRQLTLYPLSLSEILTSLALKIAGEDLTELGLEKKLEVIRVQKKFLQFGGFPRAWIPQDTSILSEYYQNILSRDIMRRKKIRNSLAIERMGNVLMGNIGRKINKSKLATTIGVKNADTIEKYIQYFEECYLGFEIRKFDSSVRNQLRNQTKFYAIDQALAARVGMPTDSKETFLFENMVLLELKRRGAKVFYWQSTDGIEVDFIVETVEKKRQLIQVCWSIEDSNTLTRELKGIGKFVEANKNLRIDEKIIVTWDGETRKFANGVVEVPFFTWATSRHLNK